MIKKSILPLLGFALAMIFSTPNKANAEVFVGVNIGPVIPRPGYVLVARRPYAYRYHRPRVVAAPPRGYFYRGRWYPRPYARRYYYGPRYFRR
jgi:hypothetical protein